MRETFLPLHRPSIGEEEIQEVADTLRSGWITTGPRVKRFEEDFANYLGVPYAVAVSSCTAALHLALSAIGIKPGDEVIVPTMTFSSTAQAVVYHGALPVLVDCRRDTFNLDERALAERLTAKTKAIMPVHMAGQPCAMGEILSVAETNGLKIVEDAAHALPAKYEDRNIGTIADITTFSFDPTKTITTSEGGMATTSDEDLARRIRRLSTHGIGKDRLTRSTAEDGWFYEVEELGYKYNMTDIAAAIGIHQLKKATAFRDRRKKIAERYTQAFTELEELRPPAVQPNVQPAWHVYMILLDLDRLTIDRAQFIRELKRRNIGVTVHFMPLHMHPFYRETFGYRKGDFPNAEWVYERNISLPIFPDMIESDVEDVIEAVQDVVKVHRR